MKRNINGVLLLNKPYGITSNRALQITKRLFSAAKSGHTGTLDPMATGLLPICFGEATKFSSVLLGADKIYGATLKLGYMSSTGDAEGEIASLSRMNTDKVVSTLHECKDVLQRFIGHILQIPPMYSALKYRGKPLYAYARNGEEIERKPREVVIHDLHIESFVDDELRIIVKCGTGTYIRTLAEDIGKALGYGGAYLTKLCRSSIDRFDLSQGYTLTALEGMTTGHLDNCLYPVDSLLCDFPAVTLDDMTATFLFQGRIISNRFDTVGLSEGDNVRLYNQEKQFLGLGKITAERAIAAKRLVSNTLFSTN